MILFIKKKMVEKEKMYNIENNMKILNNKIEKNEKNIINLNKMIFEINY